MTARTSCRREIRRSFDWGATRLECGRSGGAGPTCASRILVGTTRSTGVTRAERGGRWNPPESFPVVYLCQTRRGRPRQRLPAAGAAALRARGPAAGGRPDPRSGQRSRRTATSTSSPTPAAGTRACRRPTRATAAAGSCPTAAASRSGCGRIEAGLPGVAARSAVGRRRGAGLLRQTPAAPRGRPVISRTGSGKRRFANNATVSDQRHPGGLSSQEAAKRLRQLGPIEDRTEPLGREHRRRQRLHPLQPDHRRLLRDHARARPVRRLALRLHRRDQQLHRDPAGAEGEGDAREPRAAGGAEGEGRPRRRAGRAAGRGGRPRRLDPGRARATSWSPTAR